MAHSRDERHNIRFQAKRKTHAMSLRWLLTALSAGLLIVGAQAAFGRAGGEAPDFVLKSSSGQNLRLSEYRGQVVMLAFSATWCSDCRAQLEALASMQSAYREAGVELLAVSLDRPARQAGRGAASPRSTYAVLHDAGGEVGRLYAVERVPSMVLIDRVGVVREIFDGFARGNDKTYLERLQALLRE